MKEFKEQLTGFISEEELQELANGANVETHSASPVISLSVLETISLVTEFVCPSTPCTTTGYCQ